MKRDWQDARAKVAAEGRCRVGQTATSDACEGVVEAAHVIGRQWDPRDGRVRAVDVVPLCRKHHRAYDARLFDLEPYMRRDEMMAAVGHVGLSRAYQRINPRSQPATEPYIRT